jgi:EmrB/QacA subfamily drug resistance transporter
LLALLVMLGGTFMVVLDFFIVNVAIPSIQHDLNASAAALEWVVAGYGLANAAMLITGGRLGDMLGRRRLFGIGIAAFTVASAACGLAPDASTLVIARIAQGAAGALLQPQVIAMLSALYAGEQRAKAFAAYGLAMGLAAASGQVVGGALIHADWAGLGWRSCFLINLPIGALALALVPRVLPKLPARAGSRLDVIGVLLMALTLLAAIFPLVHGREHGWPWWTLAVLAAAVPLLTAFKLHQARRGSEALVPPSLFTHRRYVMGLVTTVAFFCGNASLYFVLALYLQQGLGLQALPAGGIFSALAVGFFITSMLAPRLGKVLGAQAIFMGALMLAAGHALLWAVIGHIDAQHLPWLLPVLLVQGCGLGMVMAPLSATVLAGLPAEHAGVAAGVMSTMQQVGNALGVALIGILYFGALPSVQHAFSVSLVYLFALALIVAALYRRFSRISL